MSFFGSIMNKIFHHGDAPPAAEPAPAAPAAPQTQAAAPAPPPVDVEQVLEGLAQQKGGGGNWRTSIVDLLKLLDLDSSLTARRQLADELNVHVADAGTAEENVALIKAVWTKLAENGGKVPAGLA